MLGSHITRLLLARGHSVSALVHPQSKSRTLDGLPVEIVKADLLKPSSFQSALSGCDAVINAAASTAVWPGRNAKVVEVNYTAALTLAEMALSAGVRRFVQVGSANSFSPGSAAQPGSEANPYAGWGYANDYMDSKYRAQEALLKMHATNALPLVVVCPTYMLGEYDSAPSSGRMVLSVAQGLVPGYSRGVKSFVYAGDVATAIVNALTMGTLGQCYIAAGENLGFEAFFRKVCAVASIPFRMRRIPYPAVLLAGAAGSAWARISGRPPKLSWGMARMSGIEQYYSAAKAINELQMPQTEVDVAIERCLRWCRENGVRL